MKKSVWVVMLSLLLVAAVLFGADVSKDAKKKVSKAEKALKEKDYEQAIALCQEAIQAEPGFAKAYAVAGQVLLAQGKMAEAADKLEKVVSLEPANAQAADSYAKTVYKLGMDWQQKQDAAKSNEYLLKFLAIPKVDSLYKKPFVTALYYSGNNYLQQRDFEKSSATFVKLIQVPGVATDMAEVYANALYMAGNTFGRLGKFEKSNQYLNQFLDFNKGKPADQWSAAANYLIGFNYYSKLNQQVDKIKAEPLSKESQEKITKIQTEKDKVTKSNRRDKKEQLAKLDSDITAVVNEETAIKKGKIAAAAKEAGAVVTYFSKAIEQKPDLEDAYVQLGNYYYWLQSLDEAIKVYKTLIEKFPASANINTYKNFEQQVLEKEKAQKK